MTEIKIEKKTTVWPWILLALIAIAAIYYFTMDEDDKEAIEETITEEEVIEENDYVENDSIADYQMAYNKYSDYIGDEEKMGIDHVYSNGALMYLINAVEAKADVLDVDVDADLDEARENAEEITDNPEDLDHADLIKNSGTIITRALTTIQKEKYPNLEAEVAEVDQAVSKIKKSTKTLNQKDDVNRFFKSAETLLSKMN